MKPRGPFHAVKKGNVVEIWLGPPNDGESEHVLTIDKNWLPALIAALKALL